ncbi:MAG: hypothetical protein AAFR93_16115 [Pseudomonadota bacterium]
MTLRGAQIVLLGMDANSLTRNHRSAVRHSTMINQEGMGTQSTEKFMKSPLFALVAVVCAFVFGTAQASTTATVNGVDYEIEFITGTFTENQSLLESQVFFDDDRSLAAALATEVFGEGSGDELDLVIDTVYSRCC